MVFTGKVADGYLQSYGASAELLKDPTWVNHSSDIVASAVFDWYVHYPVDSDMCAFLCYYFFLLFEDVERFFGSSGL